MWYNRCTKPESQSRKRRTKCDQEPVALGDTIYVQALQCAGHNTCIFARLQSRIPKLKAATQAGWSLSIEHG
eukprot:m.271881 g.271881  ORF g.271881 m.271881 type:complete len:72 (+) comp26878_c3_seq1:91-306(+)